MSLEWNPTTKRNLGLALCSVCILATAGWAWSSFKSADLIGSPYLWAAVLIGYFTGVALIGASWELAIDEVASRKIRKVLVLYFMAVAVIVGFLFLLIHLAIGGHPPAVGQKYVPWTLLASLLTYLPFYYYKVHPARLRGMGTILVPMIYMLGITFFPFVSIDYYNKSSQEVEIINAIQDLPSAKSSFLAVENLAVEPRFALDYNYHFVESDGRHKVVYTGLLPVNTGRPDTLFNVWLLFYEKDYFSNNLAEDIVIAKERDFFFQNRNTGEEKKITGGWKAFLTANPDRVASK